MGKFPGWSIPGKKPARKQNPSGAGSEDGDVRPAVATFVALQYPKARLYICKDGNIKSAGNAHKNTLRGHPDLIIYPPVPGPLLYIELKKPGVSLRQKRSPEKWADKHFAEQAEYMRFLRKIGHYAVFAVGAEEAEEVIRAYFAGQDVNELSAHKLN